MEASNIIQRKLLLARAYDKYDNTFPWYWKDQYAREALEYMSDNQLRAYVVYEYFSFSFIFTIIYLEILSIDGELLSAFIISEQAIQIEQKTRNDLALIQRMKTEHYRKYGTFFEKIKTYLKLN